MGFRFLKSDPEVMTVGVEIHEKHDDTFFLGNKRYIQVYLQREDVRSSPHGQLTPRQRVSQESAHNKRVTAITRNAL
jgi:hypothetical protein